ASQKVRSTALRRVAKCSTYLMYVSAFATPPRLLYIEFWLGHLGLGDAFGEIGFFHKDRFSTDKPLCGDD
ncbi:MAG: hypothetical protein M0017_03245, partial [Desulfobacteraceae bacterium]|nr:hypothetical protein [Desulfobacteraceae bacterium]